MLQNQTLAFVRAALLFPENKRYQDLLPIKNRVILFSVPTEFRSHCNLKSFSQFLLLLAQIKQVAKV